MGSEPQEAGEQVVIICSRDPGPHVRLRLYALMPVPLSYQTSLIKYKFEDSVMENFKSATPEHRTPCVRPFLT